MEPGNDIYSLLMGDTADSKEAARALTELLRFKKGAALVGAQSMDPAKQAAFLQGQASGDQKELFGGLEKRMQHGAEKQAFTQRLAHDAEQARLNRAIQEREISGRNAMMLEAEKGRHALERTLAGNNPGSLQQMADGIYNYNKHDQRWEKIPGSKGTIDVAEAKEAAKPAKTKTFTYPEVKDLKQLGQEVKDITAIRQSFKPEYANKGVWDEVPIVAGRVLGSMADKSVRDQTNWWGAYRNKIELLKKHALFGSAFTVHESRAWKAANRIQPGTDAETVKRLLSDMEDELREILDGHVAGRVEENYSKKAADSYTGRAPSAATGDPALEAELKALGR